MISIVWISLFIGAFLAGVLQSVTGFGAGIVIIIVLSNFYSIPVASALNTSICMGLTGYLAYKYRKSIDFKRLSLPLLVYLCISVNIIRITDKFNFKALAIFFGFFLITLGIFFYFFQDRIKIKGGPVSGIICGGISGMLSGLFGIGGPTMGLYMITVEKTKEAYYGSIQFLFAIAGLVNFIARFIYGYYTLDLIPTSLVGTVAIVLGATVGVRISQRIDIPRIKKIVYAFVSISGFVEVLRNLI